MNLRARLKRLEQSKRRGPKRCSACEGRGRIGIVLPGGPEPAGCQECGRVLRVEITEWKPGDPDAATTPPSDATLGAAFQAIFRSLEASAEPS